MSIGQVSDSVRDKPRRKTRPLPSAETALTHRVDPPGTSTSIAMLASVPRATRVGAEMSLQEAVWGSERGRGSGPSASTAAPRATKTAQPHTAPPRISTVPLEVTAHQRSVTRCLGRLGSRHALDGSSDHIGLGQTLGLPLDVQDDPVCENGFSQSLNVLRCYVVTAPNERTSA